MTIIRSDTSKNVYESVNGTGMEGPATNQGFTVNSSVYSYDEVNNVEIEGIYSIVENKIIKRTQNYKEDDS